MSRSKGILAVLLLASAASAQQQPPPPAQQPPQPAPVPAVLQNYKPVTTARLKNPEEGDWLMIRRTYDGWGHSPLKQITAANVARLQPAWVLTTGMPSGHEAPPIVNNGVMFVSTPGNQVIALDAKAGTILWRYTKPLAADAVVLHRTSRGVALFGDKVFFAAADAELVALDVKTGKEAWKTKVEENKNGYYMTLAPLVADGKVLVGVSGGELGIRGFVAAYNVDTGAQVWKTFMVPAPGEPGSDTWPKGDQWKTGGAATWVTGNYDADANLVYWGTGNGGPWMGDQRPGDNLYTSSTVALDGSTGQIKGHFQYQQNESWDWDEVSPPILVDFQRNGRTVKGLINVARDGYLWFLERAATGKISFVEGKPFVKQNVFKSLDPVTGRPDVDLAHKPGTGKMVEHCPSLSGGKNWPPIAFNPDTRMIYIPANENICGTSIGREVEYVPGKSFTGASLSFFLSPPKPDHFGEVQAWNVDTGQRVWTHNFPKSINWGPMLSTAGGLIFSGGTNDRMFRAYDAKSGKVLWEAPTSSGVLGTPTSFVVDGRQYIAVQSGWGVDARGVNARLNGFFPGEYPEVPEGGSIWVFAVK